MPIEKKFVKSWKQMNSIKSASGFFLQNLIKDYVFSKIHSPDVILYDVKNGKKSKFGDLRNLINFAKRRQAKKELLLKQ